MTSQIYKWMKDIEQMNPDLISSAVYGHTYEKRNITLLKVTNTHLLYFASLDVEN